MTMTWKGVMPAMTTCFNPDLSIDHDFVGRHCKWLIQSGCTGIVTPGSLGEAATLDFNEKVELWQTCVTAAGDRAPVVAAISALSTAEGVALAKGAAERGCQGLMVLPPYVYRGDWREMKAYISEILKATNLSCMLYNNPVSYGTDFLPEHIQELASEHVPEHRLAALIPGSHQGHHLDHLLVRHLLHHAQLRRLELRRDHSFA